MEENQNLNDWELRFLEAKLLEQVENVYLGKDHTLHARVDGLVKFTKKRNNKSYVSVEPFDA